MFEKDFGNWEPKLSKREEIITPENTTIKDHRWISNESVMSSSVRKFPNEFCVDCFVDRNKCEDGKCHFMESNEIVYNHNFDFVKNIQNGLTMEPRWDNADRDDNVFLTEMNRKIYTTIELNLSCWQCRNDSNMTVRFYFSFTRNDIKQYENRLTHFDFSGIERCLFLFYKMISESKNRADIYKFTDKIWLSNCRYETDKFKFDSFISKELQNSIKPNCNAVSTYAI